MASQRRLGVVLGYANIVVKNLVNLVYTPMLLAFIGQAEYGVFQTANSFVFSLTLLSFGFSSAYIRFYTQRKAHGTPGDIRRLNGMYLVLYAVICAAALGLGLLFAANVGLFFSGSFTPDEVGLAGRLMAVMAVNVSATLLSTVFDAYILAHEQFKFQQSRQLVTTLATPAIAFALLGLGMGALGVALAQLAVTLALLALNVRFAVGRLGMRFDVRHFDGALLRSLVAFSAWLFANQVCDLVNQNVPNMVLGALSGASAVAVFAVAVQIRNVFISLSTAMSNVFVPEVNRMVAASGDNAGLTRLMTRVGRYQLVLFCWVYGGFAVVGRFFVGHWAGEGFSDAYWLVLAMALPLAVPLCQNTGIEVQRAKNRHKARSVVYLAMAALNVAFTVLASPAIGCWAPAVGYIASIVLGNCLFMNWYYQARIGLDMAYFWKRVTPVAVVSGVATLVCLAGTWLLPVEGWPAFFGWGLAYTAVFAVFNWAFVADANERSAIVSRTPFLKGRSH